MSESHNKSRQQKTDAIKEQSSATSSSNGVGSSPTRHVGKTLESDPGYNDLPEGFASSITEDMVFRGGTDLTATPNMKVSPLAGTEIHDGREVAEQLKTRLPGDTSSDPHTDVGRDNATTVQERDGGHKRK